MQLRKNLIQLGRALGVYSTTVGIQLFVNYFFQTSRAETMGTEQSSSLGSEFTVNTMLGAYTPAVAASNTTIAAVWRPSPQSSRTDLKSVGYDLSGNVVAPEFTVPTDTTYSKVNPKVAAMADNSFLYVWTSSELFGGGQDGNRSGIFARHYDSFIPRTVFEYQVNNYTIGNQYLPDVIGLPTGDSVIVWVSYGQDGDLGGIYAVQQDSQDRVVVPEFRVNNKTQGDQSQPAGAGLENGEYVIAYTSLFNFVGYQVQKQHFYKNGSKFGIESNVSALSGSQITGLDVASISNTSYSVVFAVNGNIFEQVYDYFDNPIGSLRRINNDTTYFRDKPAIAGSAGTYTIVYESNNQDGSSTGIFGTRSNSVTRTQLGSEFRVNDFVNGTQTNPAIAALPGGGFVPIWDSNGQYINYNAYAKIYGIPRLINNSFAITERQVLIFDNSMLSATSLIGTADQLFFTISNLLHGVLFRGGNSNATTTSFNQAEINNRSIALLPDGSKFAPSFGIQVAVGGMVSPVMNASINFFVVNNLPLIVANRLRMISPVVVLTNFDLRATDVETPAAALRFLMSNLSHCVFRFVNTSQITTNFLQLEVINGNIEIAHDLSPNAPSYWVSVTDGENTTGPESANITFLPSNLTLPASSSEPEPSSLATEIGSGVAAGVIAVAGLGAFGFWYRNKTRDEQTRKGHEFANYIREVIKLGNIDDFSKGEGAKFLAWVETDLVNEFNQQGMNIDSNRTEKDLKKIANSVAEVAKYKITSAVTCTGQSIITVHDLKEKTGVIVSEVIQRLSPSGQHLVAMTV